MDKVDGMDKVDETDGIRRGGSVSSSESTLSTSSTSSTPSTSSTSFISLAVLLAHVGFFTLIAQSILIREFLVLYLGGEVALGVFYAAWLGWIGVGAAAYLPFARPRGGTGVLPAKSRTGVPPVKSRTGVPPVKSRTGVPPVERAGNGDSASDHGRPLQRDDAHATPTRGQDARATAVSCLAFLPPALLLELAALRWGRSWTGVPASEIVPLGRLALATVLATSLIGLPAGFGFSAACRAVTESGTGFQPVSSHGQDARATLRWVGFLFGFEAVGGFVGGVVYTFYLVDKLSPDGVAWLLAGLAGLHLAAWGIARPGTARRKRGPARRLSYDLACLGAVFVLGAIAQIVLPSGRQRLSESQARRFARSRPGFELVASAESRYERLELARRDGQYTLFANGKVAFSFPERLDARNRAALAMAQQPQGARRILLLGSAETGLLAQLLGYPGVERIDVADLNPRVSDIVRPYMSDDDVRVLNDPRVRRHYVDPRAFVNRVAPEGAYDLVIVDAPDPTSASVNRLYTVEFFARARKLLRPGGVLVTGITSSANYLGRDVADYAGSVVATVRRAFGTVELAPGDYMAIFACAKPGVVTLDAGELAKRFAALPRPARDVFPPEGFATLLPPNDVEAVRGRFAAIRASLNTDARPMTYYFGTIVWARFAGSTAVGTLFRTAERVGPGLLAAFLALAVAFRLAYVWRDRAPDAAARAARFDAAATTAALGYLGMSVSILLILAYQCSVGLLYERIGLLAALFMAGLATGSIGVGMALNEESRPRRVLLLFVAAMGILLLVAGRFLPGSARNGAALMAMLAGAGTLAGGAFAASARVFGDAAGRTGAWLDAADHTGGALGAIVTGTLAVPLLGFPATAWAGSSVALSLIAIHGQRLFLPRAREADAVATGPVGTAAVRDGFRPWAWTLVFILVVSYLWGAESHRQAAVSRPTATGLPMSQIEAWTGEKSWERKETPILHWEAPAGKSAGATANAPTGDRRVVFATDQTAPEVRGYAGPITLAIDMDRSTVRGVFLVRHDETPSYVSGLAEWLKGFAGLPADRPAQIGHDVDAITGATVTSHAVVETVNRSVYRASRELLGLAPDAEAFAQPSWRKGLLSRESILVAACFLVFFPVYRWGGDRARLTFLVLTVVVLGLGLNREFTLLEIGNLALGRLPSAANAAGMVMAVGVVVVTLLLGNAFCGYICPFGAIQEIGDRFARGGESGRFFVAGRLRALRGVRYVLAAAALSGFALAWGEGQHYVTWSPLETFYSWNKPALLWASAVAALGASLALPRFWCLTLCPAGAVLSVFNRLSLLRWTPFFRRPDYARCDLGASAARPRDCLRCNRCLTLAAEPKRPSRGRETAALVLFGLALGAMAVVYWNGTGEMAVAGPVAPGASAVQGVVAQGGVGQEAVSRGREIDVRAVDEALSSGRMSEHEAMHYRRVAPAAAQTPPPESAPTRR